MITSILTLVGSFFFLIAAVGLFRMPDSYSRIHAATKASSLGIILLATASMVKLKTLESVFLSVMIILFIFVTAPMACHAISSVKYKKNIK